MSRVAVAAPAGQRVEVTSLLQHLCPFKDEVDNGTIVIEWETVTRTMELHALKEWLNGFSGDRISHEAITKAIHEGLSEVHGLKVLRVETKWHTAGMRVVCST